MERRRYTPEWEPFNRLIFSKQGYKLNFTVEKCRKVMYDKIRILLRGAGYGTKYTGTAGKERGKTP